MSSHAVGEPPELGEQDVREFLLYLRQTSIARMAARCADENTCVWR